MPITPEARHRLAEAMESRRLELRLRWQDVAEVGALSLKTLHSVRTGDTGTGIAPLTKRGIEVGLQWDPGSVDLILDGGRPVPLGVPPPGHDEDDELRFAATPAMRQAMRPHLRQVRTRLGEVRRDLGLGPSGTPSGAGMFADAPQFGDARDRADLAAFWDLFAGRGHPAKEIAELVAAFMAHKAERRAEREQQRREREQGGAA